MNNIKDKIKITLPFRPDYVSVVRLTVSGIASRMGFDFETIEDIKVSLSEVCNKLVSMCKDQNENYSVEFLMIGDKLTLIIKTEKTKCVNIFEDTDEELSISIIRALMDEVKFYPEKNIVASMSIISKK